MAPIPRDYEDEEIDEDKVRAEWRLRRLGKLPRYRKPTHSELMVGLKPIISKGPFALVWSNPHELVDCGDDDED